MSVASNDTTAVLERIAFGPANEVNPRPDSAALHPIPALVRELFCRAREARRDLIVSWKRNYRAMHNRDWRPGATSWDEQPAVNQVFPVVASCVSWMTDQRPSLEVQASAEAFSEYWDFYDKLARDMNVCLQAGFRSHMIDAEISRVLWDVRQYGVGYLKTVWEPWLADGLGDTVARRVDPFTIYPDPYARNPQDLTYIIEAKRMSVADADRIWPGAAKLIGQAGFLDDSDEAPHRLDDSVDSRRPRAALAAISGTHFDGTPVPAGTPDNYARNAPNARFRLTDSPMITVLEAYVRGHRTEDSGTEGVKKVWDDWRCVVVTGNVVLLDEPCDEVNAFGTHPYDRVVDLDIGEWYGPCLVEQLAPIQRQINWLLGSIIRNIHLMGNPVLREDGFAKTRNRRFQGRPGERLEGGQGTQWLDPPQMHPQMSLQLVEFLKGEIESISGLSAMVRGFAPQGRNAQGVIDSVQDAAFVRVRESLRNLERALNGVTLKMSASIAEFYDEPRMMSLIGEDGRTTKLALQARHFYVPDKDNAKRAVPLRFSIVPDAGSQLPTSKQARAAEAKHLYELGVIDRLEVLKAEGWPSYALVTQRVMETQAMEAAQMAAAGKK